MFPVVLNVSNARTSLSRSSSLIMNSETSFSYNGSFFIALIMAVWLRTLEKVSRICPKEPS